MESGVNLIHSERMRQITVKGWTPEHDDAHKRGELAWAAVCYAAPTLVYREDRWANAVFFRDPWPWEDRRDRRAHDGNVVRSNESRPTSLRIRQLVKAGALIAAEIERLERTQLT